MNDMDQTPPADGRPLFMVGCVRSGTTLTRNLLRRVPDFICPEETHFYRWSETFRAPSSTKNYTQNALLKKHREMDGVSEDDYRRILANSRTRAALQRGYITLYAKSKGITGPYRWFDKTPQNIYGAALIAQEFPRSRFLHLVRNPLNVVGSLIAGRHMKIGDIHGACNFWVEAVTLANSLRRAFPRRVLEIRYEDLVADVPETLERILEFAEVPHPAGLYTGKDARPERDLWRQDLTSEQATVVMRRCEPLAKSYDYDLKALLDTQFDA